MKRLIKSISLEEIDKKEELDNFKIEINKLNRNLKVEIDDFEDSLEIELSRDLIENYKIQLETMLKMIIKTRDKLVDNKFAKEYIEDVDLLLNMFKNIDTSLIKEDIKNLIYKIKIINSNY